MKTADFLIVTALLVWYVVILFKKRNMRIADVVRRLEYLEDPNGCSEALNILADIKKIYWFPFERFGYPGGIDQVFNLATSSLWRYIHTMDQEVNILGQKKIMDILKSSSLPDEMLVIMEAWGNLSAEDLEQEYRVISFTSTCNKDTLLEILSIEISIGKWLDMREVLIKRLETAIDDSGHLLKCGPNPAISLAK